MWATCSSTRVGKEGELRKTIENWCRNEKLGGKPSHSGVRAGEMTPLFKQLLDTLAFQECPDVFSIPELIAALQPLESVTFP